MIRVLVVDDSPTARGLLASILGSTPDIAVVGEAEDGDRAIRLAIELHPDVILMDLHMPVLDGLGATREIMVQAPAPIVMMTSDAGAVAGSLRAIEAGALDLIPKPPGPKVPGFEAATRRLVKVIRAMAGLKVVRRRPPSSIAGPRPSAEKLPACRVVAIAASTGGPAALRSVLGGLPADFPAPILIVQHIARDFTPGLVSWLDSNCALRVKVAEAGEPTAPGVAYVSPEDHHLGIAASAVLTLTAGPPIGGFRPSATALFTSVATAFGPAVAAVILTGMGEDGTEGLRVVHRNGGKVIAQDEATSIVFGMPRAAIAAGVADAILPLEHIAARIAAIADA